MATQEFIIDPFENQYLAILGGHLDENYRLLEKRFGVEISNRANVFKVIGDSPTYSFSGGNSRKSSIKKLLITINSLSTERLHVIVQAGCQQLSDQQCLVIKRTILSSPLSVAN